MLALPNAGVPRALSIVLDLYMFSAYFAVHALLLDFFL